MECRLARFQKFSGFYQGTNCKRKKKKNEREIEKKNGSNTKIPVLEVILESIGSETEANLVPFQEYISQAL